MIFDFICEKVIPVILLIMPIMVILYSVICIIKMATGMAVGMGMR